MCNRFHEYLYWGEFEVHINNKPLTYILTTARLDVMGQRWVADPAKYDFKIFYRSGKKNVDADAMLRIPWDHERNLITMSALTAQAIFAGGALNSSTIPKEGELGLTVHCGQVQVGGLKISAEDWGNVQESDTDIGPVVQLMKAKKYLQYANKEGDPSGRRVILKYRKDLVLKNGLLYRKIQPRGHDEPVSQFVHPASHQEQALGACHDNFGHFGIECTLHLLQEKFFWPKMNEEVCKVVEGRGGLSNLKRQPS